MGEIGRNLRQGNENDKAGRLFVIKEGLVFGMSLGADIYKELLTDLRRECDEMVQNGELSEEDADFRFSMMSDDILDGMPDEWFADGNCEVASGRKWNQAEDGHCRLHGCSCIHDGCAGCPVEQCYSYPASYSDEG